ncbi:porin family protein [Hymenobacter mucosus]|uniref:Outer membrane protein beta-barrel domain-containing protein n=1 Tax=Hymenobacter mucosus TaxID=1411120 RepID=A0A238W4E0_9BACT|nr:porin family protein [Hymenobacter mucosus]SNR41194.1 Outer membrane protein beta-barrel domain-containing protein [Hymenobacter mucosus]
MPVIHLHLSVSLYVLRNTLIGALLLMSVPALPQTNFKPGYVLPLSGDTLRGQVDSRGERRNATVCRFRPSSDAAVTEYTPAQLRGYGFTSGREYQSQTLPTAGKTQVFVQALVVGKTSLYRYADQDDTEFYYAQAAPGTALLPLVQSDTTVVEYNQQTHAETKTRTRVYPFRNVLWTIMADCPAVQTTLTRTELAESQLVKVFSAYNVCKGGEQRVTQRPKTRLRFAVLGGGYQADVDFNGNIEKELHSSMRPSYGIGIQLHPGSFNQHLSIVAQAIYVEQEYSAAYTGTGSLGSGYERTLQVNLSSVRVPLLLRYSLTRGPVRPYIQGGGVFAVHTKHEGQETDYYPRFSSQVTTTPLDLRAYGTGLTVGLGVLISTGQAGDINLEARLDSFDSTSQSSGLLSGARGLSLLAGYTFGK